MNSKILILSISTFFHLVCVHNLNAEDMMQMNMDTNSTRMASPTIALNSSGTGWLPETFPMYAIHSSVSDWSIMNHGSAYVRFTDQNAINSSKRGERAADAPNWIMSMWDRSVNPKNTLRLRGMLSLDRLTEGGDGYPLLFQTGETFKGSPLIDRQHPHDLFMELSTTWAHALSRQNTLFVYFGFPGEPALGPTTYMHRPSGDMNADAPLSHHWQDATHITFGVFSFGTILNKLKFDASIFTGREPDENRWNFDPPRFDSYSGRISFRFSPGIESQISAGYLHSPESLHPEANQVRITSSVETAFVTHGNNTVSSSLVYGGNIETERGSLAFTNSLLAETELALTRWIPYTRYEFVQKRGMDFGIANALEKTFYIHAITAGCAFRVVNFVSLSLFAGAQGTMDVPDKRIWPEYGKLPLSYELFIRIRPSGMSKTFRRS